MASPAPSPPNTEALCQPPPPPPKPPMPPPTKMTAFSISLPLIDLRVPASVPQPSTVDQLPSVSYEFDEGCCVSPYRGEAGGLVVNLVWDIGCFNLAAKFRTPNPGASSFVFQSPCALHAPCLTLCSLLPPDFPQPNLPPPRGTNPPSPQYIFTLPAEPCAKCKHGRVVCWTCACIERDQAA